MEDWHTVFWWSKPVIYWLLLAAAQWRWREQIPGRWWRPVAAALTRAVAGLALGIPLGAFLIGQNNDVLAAIVFTVFRFVLWFIISWLFFSKIPIRRILLLSAVATAINIGLDAAIYEGGPFAWTDERWG